MPGEQIQRRHIERCNGTALEENLEPAQCIDHHEDNLVKGRRIQCSAMYLAHIQSVLCGCAEAPTEEPSKEYEDA